MKRYAWCLVLVLLAGVTGVAGLLALSGETGLFVSSPETLDPACPGSGKDRVCPRISPATSCRKRVPLGAQSRYSEDGSFRVDCYPGKLILEVEAPEHEKAAFEIEVPHGVDEVKDVMLELEKSPEREPEEKKE